MKYEELVKFEAIRKKKILDEFIGELREGLWKKECWHKDHGDGKILALTEVFKLINKIKEEMLNSSYKDEKKNSQQTKSDTEKSSISNKTDELTSEQVVKVKDKTADTRKGWGRSYSHGKAN